MICNIIVLNIILNISYYVLWVLSHLHLCQLFCLLKKTNLLSTTKINNQILLKVLICLIVCKFASRQHRINSLMAIKCLINE